MSNLFAAVLGFTATTVLLLLRTIILSKRSGRDFVPLVVERTDLPASHPCSNNAPEEDQYYPVEALIPLTPSIKVDESFVELHEDARIQAFSLRTLNSLKNSESGFVKDPLQAESRSREAGKAGHKTHFGRSCGI